MINSSSKLIGLFGQPVSQSFSPSIHNYLSKKYKKNNVYMCFEIEKNNLEKAVFGIKALNMKGCNVTIPYKVDVIPYLDEVDKNALLIGAVNTIKNKDNRLIGYNTDGVGFVKSLLEENYDLKNKNIDYLALGHVHGYLMEKLDHRGTYCYPGCLEGRGFDECGEKGFVLVDVDENTRQATYRFVPFAARTLYTLEVDAKGVMTTRDAAERMEKAISEAGYTSGSLVKFVLTGEVDVDTEINVEYLQELFTDYFYYEKVYDCTTLHVDFRDYENDASLKGEFIRMVLASELTEEQKSKVIRCGIMALSGEEV